MKRFTEKFKKLFAVVKKKTTELLIRLQANSLLIT